MKKMNYLFYTGVIIIIFLIVTPTYWQYEVNEFHDATYSYKINDFRGETVGKSYALLKKISENDSNTFYIVRPESPKNTEEVDMKYYFTLDQKPKNYTVKHAIRFETHTSDSVSFSESNGYFFSDLPYDQLHEKFSKQNLSLSKSPGKYENDLSRFPLENALPILVVVFFTFIISIILTLKDMKEVALLSLQGMSDFTIKRRLTYRMFKSLLTTSTVIFLLYSVYKLLSGNYLSLAFFKFYSLVLLLTLIVYTCLYFVSLSVISFVNIINVLKNKDYTKPAYLSLIVIQMLILLLLPILFSNFLDTYKDINHMKHGISRVYELKNYYTYYGTNANYYDSLNHTELSKISKQFEKLYTDHADHGYYFEPVFSTYVESYGKDLYQMPKENIAYMDAKYYNELASFNKKPINKAQNNMILIPSSFKKNTKEILDTVELIDENVDIVYIDDTIELSFDDYNSAYDSETFRKKGIHNVFVITSPTNLANIDPSENTIFLGTITNGSIFFKEDSLKSMTELTEKYQLDKMVTAQSKLSPYKDSLHNLEYGYRIITYTLLLTLISVIIINSFAAEIIIQTKKKRIAVGFLHGKHIMYSLRNNFIIYTVVSLLSAGSILMMNKGSLETFTLILILYVYVCLYLIIKYLNFVNTKITTLLKGE